MKVGSSKKEIVNKMIYLKSQGLIEYEQEVVKILGLRQLPNIDDDGIIGNIIYRTLREKQKKEGKPRYYIANALCFLNTTKDLLSTKFVKSFRNYRPSRSNDLLLYNYRTMLFNLLFDAVLLLKIYIDIFHKKRKPIGVWKTPYQHSYTIYRYLYQMIFGQKSFHATKEIEPNMCVLGIRQMLELRIKNALATPGIYNKVDNSIEPLMMKDIYSVLKKYEKGINLSVPLALLRRINSWANIFVHIGLRDFIWKYITVLRYLTVFMGGESLNGHWSVNNGVSLYKTTYKNILRDIRRKLRPQRVLITWGKPALHFRTRKELRKNEVSP
jgi:hypothetical protein